MIFLFVQLLYTYFLIYCVENIVNVSAEHIPIFLKTALIYLPLLLELWNLTDSCWFSGVH